jgi:hypothetical protein
MTSSASEKLARTTRAAAALPSLERLADKHAPDDHFIDAIWKLRGAERRP